MKLMHSDGPQVADPSRVVVIPRENAVFWLDGEGFWRNQGGKFRNKRIIDYFHRAISRDAGGYFVWQDKGGIVEKVYFPYEDTALFVSDVVLDGSARLFLNTGLEIDLEDGRLFTRHDNLYLDADEDTVKFTVRAMLKLSDNFEESADGRLWVRTGKRVVSIESG